MVSFNRYATRAALGNNGALRFAGRNYIKANRFVDHLFGISKSNVKNKLNTLNELGAKPGLVNNTEIGSLKEFYSNKLNMLTRRGNTARLKTGLGIGAAGLAAKAMSNYHQSQNNYNNYYSNYQSDYTHPNL